MSATAFLFPAVPLRPCFPASLASTLHLSRPVSCPPIRSTLVRACFHSPEFKPIAASPISASPISAPHHEEEDQAADSAYILNPNLGGDIPIDIGSGNFGGSGSDRPDDGESFDDASEDPERALNTLLSKRNVSQADLPANILKAYRTGLIPLHAVSNYLVARANPISRVLLGIGPMRDRFLADRLFLLKILIEEGIGIFGKLSAEYQQRRSDFWQQGEYVAANLIIAILADFALVFFPAPSLSIAPSCPASGLSSWFANLSASVPSNIFQTDRPFTLAQRAGGLALKGGQLFAAGLCCCFVGVILTNTLVAVRERLDPNYKPVTTKQNPLAMSAAYALFLGVSSGTRYQLVNGVESHIFPRLFHAAPAAVEEVATFFLRYANTFWGSSQWVIFSRLLKLEKLKKVEVNTE